MGILKERYVTFCSLSTWCCPYFSHSWPKKTSKEKLVSFIPTSACSTWGCKAITLLLYFEWANLTALQAKPFVCRLSYCLLNLVLLADFQIKSAGCKNVSQTKAFSVITLYCWGNNRLHYWEKQAPLKGGRLFKRPIINILDNFQCTVKCNWNARLEGNVRSRHPHAQEITSQTL